VNGQLKWAVKRAVDYPEAGIDCFGTRPPIGLS